MIRNYFIIAIRNLSRHKLFSFITIFGLALSMSVCLLVLMRIKNQLDFDKFHPYPNRTYRIITELDNKEGRSFRFANTPLPLATTLANDYTIVDKWVRLYPAANEKALGAKKELSLNPAFTDSSFFEVFGFSLAYGDIRTALTAPNSIVLTKETATRFFGAANPIGQPLHMEKLGSFQVTGVMNAPAGKSHIDYEAYISMSSVPVLEKTGKLNPLLEQWNFNTIAYTYIVLKEAVKEKQLARAIQQEATSLMKVSVLKGKESLAFEAQPLSKIILGEELMNSIGNIGSVGKVFTEVAIAFIILVSACFNYTNLSIARSLSRGKEVGIRKVAGARRYQVFNQFITESLLITFLAFGLACILLKLMINYALFSGDKMVPDSKPDTALLIWFLVFTFFTGLLAGLLPAWALSSFNPVLVLKNLTTVKLFGGNGFRKGLITAQFTLCLVITIFTTIFFRQFNYMATADKGFDSKNIVTIPLKGTDYKVAAEEIARASGVQKVTAVSGYLGIKPTGKSNVKLQAGFNPVQMDYFDVDSNFISVMNLKLLAGTTFPATAGFTKEQYVIVNENALQSFNLKTPFDAIGKTIWLDDSIPVQVAGVLKDFYYQQLALPVTPLLLRYRPKEFTCLNVKTASGNTAIVKAIQQIWNNNNPQQPFESKWLDDVLYEKHSPWNAVSMLAFLSFISVTIACLGMLGIVVYTTETRRKEIGIRKVMGASVAAILSLLSGKFLKMIVIAGLIAMPLSYVAGYLFLNLFANRITIGMGSLLLCFFSLLLLVLVTTGSQIYKVAISNPVKSLRAE